MRRLPVSTTQIVVALIALLVGYLLFSAAGDVLRTQRLNRDEGQVRDQISQLEQQEQELIALRDFLQSDAYIERVARQVLGLVQPGETPVIVSSSATPQPPSGQDPLEADRPWWEAVQRR